MKAWFGNYLSLIGAIYFGVCAGWFAFALNWDAAAGYSSATIGWLVIYYLEQTHKRVTKMYTTWLKEAVEECEQYREGQNNAT